MVYGKRVYAWILVDARVTFAAIQAAGERRREFAYQAVVRKAKVAELECEADEMRQEVWSMNATVDEDGAVDVRVGESRESGRLED